MLGGGFFDMFTRDKTKFAYILANHAINDVITNATQKLDDKTKKLLLHGFHKLFLNLLSQYSDANIKINKNTPAETIGIIFNKISSYKFLGDNKYEIVKYKDNNIPYDQYMVKLKGYITLYVQLLLKQVDITNNRLYYQDTTNTEIKKPTTTRNNGQTYSQTTFYAGNNETLIVENILFKITNPDVPASNTNKAKTKIKKQHEFAYEFINSISTYSKGLYYYMKFLCNTTN